MAPINVLWVIDHVCYDGSLHGGGRLYWNVLPRFDPDRVRVVPCLLRADDTIRGVFARSPVPVRILDKGKFAPSTLTTLLRVIKDADIHVMHLHCYGASTFGRLAALATGVPAIIHDYDTEVYFPYPWYLGLADRLLAPVTRTAIAASPMVRDFLMRKRKIGAGRIVTLLHAVPPDKFRTVTPEERRRVRARLGIGEEAPVVGTVTKLGVQRGNEYLLRAAALVRERVPDAVFLVVYKPTVLHRPPSQQYLRGTPTDAAPWASELHALVSALGLESHVRLLPWPEDLDEVVGACDVLVAPFLSERFSSVNVLEGMALGKPVIATDIGELREVVEDGVNGALVPPGDVDALAEAIARMLGSPAERERLGARARASAAEQSADAYARRLDALYHELAAGGAPGGRRGGHERSPSAAERVPGR